MGRRGNVENDLFQVSLEGPVFEASDFSIFISSWSEASDVVQLSIPQHVASTTEKLLVGTIRIAGTSNGQR
jgi:hypothetical protein